MSKCPACAAPVTLDGVHKASQAFVIGMLVGVAMGARKDLDIARLPTSLCEAHRPLWWVASGMVGDVCGELAE